MSIAEKLATIAENEQRVFSAGYNGGYTNGYADGDSEMSLKLWDMLTAGGTRKRFYRTFTRTDFSDYVFPVPLITDENTDCESMFYDYGGAYLPKNIGFEKLSPSCNVTYMFCWSTGIAEIYDIGLPAMDDYACMFNSAYKIKKIAVLRCHKDTTFRSAFLSNSAAMALEEITFEGIVGQNIDMSPCKKLTYESLRSLIDCLYDYSETEETRTLGLGTANTEKLTEAEIAEITQKGWSVT